MSSELAKLVILEVLHNGENTVLGTDAIAQVVILVESLVAAAIHVTCYEIESAASALKGRIVLKEFLNYLLVARRLVRSR